jgi:hypothetical protein
MASSMQPDYQNLSRGQRMSKTRSPALRLLSGATEARSEPPRRRIAHDARGNAVWVGEAAVLEDTSSLTLVVDSTTTSCSNGDPYNQPARAVASRASAKKRR